MAVINGTAGSDTLSGTSSADTIDGLGGVDTLAGALGNDTYIVDDAGDTITENVNQGIDLVKASVSYTLGANVENLTLTGASAINATGNSLKNTLTGNSGNNILDGDTGADRMLGGNGNDTYIVDNSSDLIIENSGQGTDIVQSSVTYTLAKNVEVLVLTGASAINGSGSILANTIIGNTAANILDGGIGTDTLVGGQGNDTYIVDNAADVITENSGEGIDLVKSSVNYTLGATDIENLTLTGSIGLQGTGNSLNNTITGNSGANVLDGGTGADTLIGGVGNDIYAIDNAGDIITEQLNQGTDLVRSSISYTLGINLEKLVLTGTANINATGNSLSNSLTGNSGNNILDGGTGADKMFGGGGDDTYLVDSIGDTTTETTGQGTDLVQSSITYILSSNLENLTLTGAAAVNGTGNSLVNILIGNSAVNILDGGIGADTLVGGQGNDTYVVDNAGDVVTENTGEGTDLVLSSVTYTLSADVENLTLSGTTAINGIGNVLDNTIVGNNAANTLTGGGGNDFLDGGMSNDTMIGGLGDDTYIIGNTGDIITENAGEGTELAQAYTNYTLAAEVENATLMGTLSTSLTGNSLVNILTGNSGANKLDGSTGADTLIGGAGNDTYVIDDAGDVVTENASAGTDLVQSSISYTLGANLEHLTLTGTDPVNGTGNASVNTMTGNAAANILDGMGGSDILIGGDGDDTYIIDNVGDKITESANFGTDTIQSTVTYTLGSNTENLILLGASAINGTGNSLVNTITGNSASNTLNGGTGADTLIGGDGNDTYVVDNTSDVVTENAAEGIDLVQSSVTYVLDANVDDLTLTGTSAINGTGNADVNTITGNSAVNILDGGSGADTMIGGGGNDTYIVDDTSDVITENASAGTDLVQSSASYTLGSNIENLTLTGTDPVNGTGNASVNTITGNAGSNVLDGDAGVDTMIGGDGDDTYIVDSLSEVITENAGEGIDLIEIGLTYTLGTDFENLTLTGASAIDGTGNADVNTITGNSAVNILDGGANADTLIGGDGDDTYIVDDTSDAITENSGEGTDLVEASATYTLSAEVENLTLTDASAIDGTGNGSINTITGNSAVNILDGGTNADTLIGGGGDDTYIVDDIGDVVTENAGEGTDLVGSSVTYTLASEVEDLTLTGGGTINGTGNASVNTITGNNASNILDGGTDADTLIGGDGNDTYVVDNIGDIIIENIGEGTDLIQSSVTYTLPGNIESLMLIGGSPVNATGNASNNSIIGNTAANVLDGAGGTDTLAGGDGNDTYVVDDVTDTVLENTAEGTDLVQTNISYILGADVENLTLTGTSAVNGTGNTGANVIVGNIANNTLNGGASGIDTMTGDTGADTFVFTDATAIDIVTDFSESDGDKIDISSLLTGFVIGVSDIDDFLSLTVNGSDTTVSIDADGLVGGTAWTDIGTFNSVTGLVAQTLYDNSQIIV